MNICKLFICFYFITDFILPCAVCYGDPTDPVSIGLTKSIAFLLCVIGFVLSCIFYGIVSLVRKSNKINNIEGVK